jgi:hypothetical protein
MVSGHGMGRLRDYCLQTSPLGLARTCQLMGSSGPVRASSDTRRCLAAAAAVSSRRSSYSGWAVPCRIPWHSSSSIHTLSVSHAHSFHGLAAVFRQILQPAHDRLAVASSTLAGHPKATGLDRSLPSSACRQSFVDLVLVSHRDFTGHSTMVPTPLVPQRLVSHWRRITLAPESQFQSLPTMLRVVGGLDSVYPVA